MYIGALPACMSVYHVYSMAAAARKGHQISLESELEAVVSRDVGAGNWAKVPWKSSQCS